MKLIYVTFFLLGFMTSLSKGQSKNLPNIQFSDIEKAFTDIDNFRILLLEQKFQLTIKEKVELTENGNRHAPEHWIYTDPIGYPQTVKFKSESLPSYGTYDESLIEIQIYSMESGIEKRININFYRPLISNLADSFLDKIKLNFPLKKVNPITYRVNGGPEKSGYTLVYYKNGSTKMVEYDNTGEDYISFTIYQ